MVRILYRYMLSTVYGSFSTPGNVPVYFNTFHVSIKHGRFYAYLKTNTNFNTAHVSIKLIAFGIGAFLYKFNTSHVSIKLDFHS